MPVPKRRVVELPDAFAPPARARPDDASADPLFVALRAWRTERARADGMAPFIIAHDSTLHAITDARPVTLAQLRRVPGMGPLKLERYGSEIIAVVNGAG